MFRDFDLPLKPRNPGEPPSFRDFDLPLKPRNPGEPPSTSGPQRFERGAWAGWLVLGLIFLVDLGVFAWLGGSYLAWYLANGGLLAFGVSLLSVVGIELDQAQDLISAHPGYYLWGWVRVGDAWTQVWDPTQADPRLPAIGARPVRLDRLISRLLLVAARFALIGWFLVAGPLQYLLNLVCGAPARAALGSGKVVWEWEERSSDDQTLGLRTVSDDGHQPKPHASARRLGWDVKPVSATYALAGFALFLVARLVGLH